MRPREVVIRVRPRTAGLSRRIWRAVLRHPEIRIRVTITSGLVALILSTVLCVVLLFMVRQQAVSDTVVEMAREGRKTATLIATGRLTDRIAAPDGSLQQVVDLNGRVLAATPEMAGRQPVRFPPPESTDDRRDGRSCEVDAPGGECFIIVEYRVGFGRGAVFVFVLEPVPSLLPRPLPAALFILGVPVVTGLVAFATWVAASRALRPVDAIRRELDEITATDLERRVPQPPRRDEVGLLAESINATLDRLEKAVARQRGFVTDVSHELRSPLAALRMELELALSAPDDTAPQETMQAILDNTDRLTAVVDDLLALARLEADRNFEREPVDLTELTDQEVLTRPRRTQVTVLSEGSVTVRGGRNELARLLRNLIDNADRHAAREVTVVLRPEPPATAVVEVIDDGNGIPPEDRERVFERFTRLAQGRHRDAGGTGLGLAISRDIAEAHRGTLVLTDRPDGQPGARFVLRLPQ
ncbi:sensor histidine kinase [Actinomadura livida]|uniref:histidine kinase n=1 Tax=Actinomadura livida TaxID=79909 RepID=A0A7W7IA52_9ACTN|nr:MULTISPECIES: HAMP domain-containing sensor histidine kinase [Actinomadura]MBB4773205.1 signal transduction histidine kinase [Actinomadura catellatispora]GGU18757.1 two-component sensor histidine kinase [Actinomadura livida]